MFSYDDNDFIFSTSWKSPSVQSGFDEKLKTTWQEKENDGLFRYKYKVESFIQLPGKYGFPAVLNTDRGTKRRKPNMFTSVTEPVNDDLFNFTKVNPGEYLFKFSHVSNSSSDMNDDTLAINASPLGDFHSLILPKLNSKLPQVIDEYSLKVSIQLLLLSASPAIRVGFNSLCAFASVNHLHLHLYYLPHKMYLESCDIVNLNGPCYTILDYPSKGFVFVLQSDDLLSNFVKNVFILISYLQRKNIPHNIFITRALNNNLNINDFNDTRNCVRVFVWARAPSGDKCMDKFAPATCELFGHLVFKDKSEFSEVTENGVSHILTDVTKPSFLLIENDIKNLGVQSSEELQFPTFKIICLQFYIHSNRSVWSLLALSVGLKIDYTLLGMVSPNCMKVLPIAQNDEAEKKTQKIIVGDQEGIVQMFQIRKGKINMLFKTLPLEKITEVCLGGALGTVQDKIFLSMGTSVYGYTKKGRMFLSFDTGLSEPIKCMYVTGNELLVSGRHIFNHFNDCKDSSTYLCPELINSIVSLDVIKMQGVMPILACADLCIRILEGSTVKETFHLSSEPICLHLMKNNGGSFGNEVLAGLQNGHVVLLKIEKNASVSILWELKSQSKLGTITCIDCYEFNKEDHLLIGRQSGSVEVYSLDSISAPIEKYKYSCSESITSIQGGTIRNYGIPEIVVTTFTGWLFGLTFVDQHIDKEIVLESSNIILNDEKQKILDIRTEVSDLERQVAIERNKYLEFTQKSSKPSVLPYLTIKNTMFLDKESLIYNLIIELEATIDNVLLQCDCLIHLIDVENNSAAVVSKSKCREEDDNMLLTTYRCQLNTTKLELKMWSHEGDHGVLTVYITPLLQPKSCQVCKFSIKPLLYHQRTNKSVTHQPQSFLTLSGGFSLSEAHLWISNCLPGIPEKPASQENIEYTFESVIIDTVLLCTYCRGSINIKTDNITAISILKDNFSRDATKKNIKLDMSYDVSDGSLAIMINAIVSKLKIDIDNDRKLKLIGAIKQLSVNPNSTGESLSKEYLTMISSEDELKKEVSQRPSRMQRLQAIILALFDDWHKLRGLNMKPNSREDLQEAILTNNTPDSLISMFEI